MSKLDVYLRSIERFGAAGAVLTSGQAVTLRFPTGDRQATQVTPHDQLVVLVREIAPPAVLDQIDQQRPARFEIESQGTRYAIAVSPRPGAWSVAIEPASGGVAAPSTPAPGAPRPTARAATAPIAEPSLVEAPGDMAIERGQYDAPGSAVAITSSGSVFLDQLTTHARGSRATDIYLAAGLPPLVRAGGELVASAERVPLDGEALARELGVVAPAEARGAWAEAGSATFAYSDGAGRIRVTLSRDQRGPCAALRLLHGDAPPLGGLGLGAEVTAWLEARGLVVIAGPAGAGKTTALSALVRALGERKKLVVALEDPIEIVQTGASVSQRALREHVRSFGAGVHAAMREGADAIAIGAVDSADAAAAVVDAIAGGHLVLTTVVAPSARAAIDRLVSRLPPEQRELARATCAEALVGTIAAVAGRGGARTLEAAAGRGSAL